MAKNDSAKSGKAVAKKASPAPDTTDETPGVFASARTALVASGDAVANSVRKHRAEIDHYSALFGQAEEILERIGK